jgi:hypothetical protein
MILGACNDLMREHSGLPVVTVHDALLVNPSGEETAASTIRRTWGLAGVVPHLKFARPA